jgi:hypothetical protein
MMVLRSEFNKRKAALRQLYKRYKAGLVTQESLTDEQRFLLCKYYGLVEEVPDDGKGAL